MFNAKAFSILKVKIMYNIKKSNEKLPEDILEILKKDEAPHEQKFIGGGCWICLNDYLVHRDLMGIDYQPAQRCKFDLKDRTHDRSLCGYCAHESFGHHRDCGKNLEEPLRTIYMRYVTLYSEKYHQLAIFLIQKSDRKKCQCSNILNQFEEK